MCINFTLGNHLGSSNFLLVGAGMLESLWRLMTPFVLACLDLVEDVWWLIVKLRSLYMSWRDFKMNSQDRYEWKMCTGN